MNEMLANRSLRTFGLTAAGLLLAGCGHSTAAHQKVVGPPPLNLECTSHNYIQENPGKISVDVVDRGHGDTIQLVVSRIIAQLPNNKPVSKIAHRNVAQFDIPADYSEIDIKVTLDGYAGKLGCGSLKPLSEY